jgi:catechol 2,3-dioxygenase-like lactoylglutathione lyase family enzyme
MFDHVSVSVHDLEKSKEFYKKVLAPLGSTLVMDLKEYGAAGFGPERPQFWLGEDKTSAPQESHICFSAKDRAAVRAFYEAAIKAGGKDNGKPGPRPEYHENYYGAFVYDFDGHNIEACCRKPE